MDPSLSVVLSVHNAEATLSRQVNDLLDILPELTSRFEVLIVDNGSTDHTKESADELAREFPQLRVVRRPRRGHDTELVQTGLERATGDVVFFQNEAQPVSPTDLQKLWTSSNSATVKQANSSQRGATTKDAGVVGRLVAWGQKLGKESPATSGRVSSVQMFQRKAKAHS